MCMIHNRQSGWLDIYCPKVFGQQYKTATRRCYLSWIVSEIERDVRDSYLRIAAPIAVSVEAYPTSVGPEYGSKISYSKEVGGVYWESKNEREMTKEKEI